MKKIVFACDGKNFSNGAFEFIKWIREREPVLLTGVFFSSVNYQTLIATTIGGNAGAYLDYTEETEKEVADSLKLFENNCRKNNISYRVHHESPSWNPEEIRKETRFADLLVISAELFCSDINANQPNSYMRQVLHNAECPVVVTPEKFTPPGQVIFAYDGRKESMFALKQFCYVFPELTRLETNIVHMREDESDIIPDLDYAEEYTGCHFDNLNFQKQHFNPKKYFAACTSEEKNLMVVSGSFSRSGISAILDKSFAEDMIHDHRYPVFIAHTV